MYLWCLTPKVLSSHPLGTTERERKDTEVTSRVDHTVVRQKMVRTRNASVRRVFFNSIFMAQCPRTPSPISMLLKSRHLCIFPAPYKRARPSGANYRESCNSRPRGMMRHVGSRGKHVEANVTRKRRRTDTLFHRDDRLANAKGRQLVPCAPPTKPKRLRTLTERRFRLRSQR